METAVSTVHHNHCASSVALKRLNLLTAAAQTLHLPHCVTDRGCSSEVWRRIENCAHLASPILLKGLSWTVLNAPCSAEFKCSDCFQCPSCGSETLSHFINIISALQCSESKDVVESQRFAQLWYQASGLRYRPIWTVTHESESAVIFFNSNRIPETRTALFNEYAFQKQKWVNEHNQSKLVQVLLSSSKVETPTRCSSFTLIRDWQGSE